MRQDDDIWWPPGMPERQFQFLRGVASAINALKRQDRHNAAWLLSVEFPNALRLLPEQPKPPQAGPFYYPGDGMVIYRAPGREISPSDSEWMIPRLMGQR